MSSGDGQMTSVAAWARSLGVTRQAAHKAVRRLGIEVVGGRIHAEKATALYNALTRRQVRTKSDAAPAPESGALPPTVPHISYDEARRREAAARALMAERENLRQASELVPVQAVLDRWQRILYDLRQRLLAVPSRAASEVPSPATKPEVHAVVERLLHDALLELSRDEDGSS